LQDENRTLVREGMMLLKQTKRKGLKALFAAAKQEARSSRPSRSVIFWFPDQRVRPDGCASRAVELLLTDSESEAAELAATLSNENTGRQEIELSIFKEAVELLEGDPEKSAAFFKSRGPILVCGRDWHPGVIGIVASRLVERYRRSALVFTAVSGRKASSKALQGPPATRIYSRPSCTPKTTRSVLEAIRRPRAYPCARTAMTFSQRRSPIFEQQISGEPYEETVTIDGILGTDELTTGTCREISGLAPFGEGNQDPHFLIRNLKIVRPWRAAKAGT
jgi:single-stranded-DNA-specific exonuclease